MRSAWRGIVLLLGGFAGLCALFAGVVTAADAWREQARARWPALQARVAACEIREYKSRGRSYYIRCRVAYAVAGQAFQARIDSGLVPDPDRVIWASPGAANLGDLQAWVEGHPPGAAVELHYDPADPRAVALVNTDLPLAGPHAPQDLRVLCAFAVPALVLLLAGLAWPRRGRAA